MDRHDLTGDTLVTTMHDNNINNTLSIGTLVNLLYAFFELAQDGWGRPVLYYLVYGSLPSRDLQKKPQLNLIRRHLCEERDGRSTEDRGGGRMCLRVTT